MTTEKFPLPRFSFTDANQAEAWRAFKLHARDYLRYNKIKWDQDDDDTQGYFAFRLMLKEFTDREEVDRMEDEGVLTEADLKQPKKLFDRVETTKIQKPESKWFYRDQLMSGLKQEPEETVNKLKQRIELLVTRCEFETDALRESYKALAMARAVKYHEVRVWLRKKGQERADYAKIVEKSLQMETQSEHYNLAANEGRNYLGAHTAAKIGQSEGLPPKREKPRERLSRQSPDRRQSPESDREDLSTQITQVNAVQQKCNRCGRAPHRTMDECYARDKQCNRCSRYGHFAKMCMARTTRTMRANEVTTVQDQRDELESLQQRISELQAQMNPQPGVLPPIGARTVTLATEARRLALEQLNDQFVMPIFGRKHDFNDPSDPPPVKWPEEPEEPEAAFREEGRCDSMRNKDN